MVKIAEYQTLETDLSEIHEQLHLILKILKKNNTERLNLQTVNPKIVVSRNMKTNLLESAF